MSQDLFTEADGQGEINLSTTQQAYKAVLDGFPTIWQEDFCNRKRTTLFME